MSAETRKPTAAQLRALEGIKRGEVRRWCGLGKQGFVCPRGMRQDVIVRCIEAGWAMTTAAESGRATQPVVLTDAGRALLAAATASTGEESTHG